MVRTWTEREGDFIIYYDLHRHNGVIKTDIYVDSVRKGKTINNRL